jgi:H+/Cl- antiporter ClcA
MMEKRKVHRQKKLPRSDKLSSAPSSSMEVTQNPRARKNTSYQKLGSIDFQSFRSNVWKQVNDDYYNDLRTWAIFGLVGVLMGAVAFLVDIIVENLILWKWEITQMIIEYSSWWYALVTFIAFSALFGGIAGIMTVFLGPGAVGTGTVELIAYCNGINIPNFIGARTLFVKVLGNALAVAAGLCVGKEGPLAHIGAIVGQAVLYIPISSLLPYRNEKDKREIACAGAAAGVAAAFGSPIGGTLFIYEVSHQSQFWSFALTWKTFFASSVATFVLNILSCMKNG